MDKVKRHLIVWKNIVKNKEIVGADKIKEGMFTKIQSDALRSVGYTVTPAGDD